MCAVLLGCDLSTLIAPAVPPTLDPLSINTVIAHTAAAAATQTAQFAPPTFTFTPTAGATRTPTELPSPTVTFIFLLPTATVPSPTTTPRTSSGSGSELKFDCRIVSQNPANGTVFGVKADFDTTWRVANIGTSNWNGNSTDYRYKSGDRLDQQSAYDMSRSVPAGGEVDITVDMRAPDAAGNYSTTWVLRVGKNEFCPMTVSIVVQ
jgi:hypothetical protein